MLIISIEGNIGSGKSTLLKFLEKNLNIEGIEILFLQEPVKVWQSIQDSNNENILEKFYKDQDKYSFSFQIMAYISRIAELRQSVRKLAKTKKFPVIITERCVETDKYVFASMLKDDGKIDDIHFNIYNMWFNEFNNDCSINQFVFINTNPDVAFERIKKRNRTGETIPIEYLRKCNEYHENWLLNGVQKVDNSRVLLIDGNRDIETSKYLDDALEVFQNIILKNVNKC